MANTDAFALQRSDLNGFLFADIGVEANGSTLSVLSSLARLGIDPWLEAGRLAKLPRTAAVDGLARIIAAIPSGLCPLPDAPVIGVRLVALLPVRGASVQPVAAVPSWAKGAWASNKWTIVAILLAAVLAVLTLNVWR